MRLAVHPLANEANLMTVERAVSRVAWEFLMMEYLNKGLEQMREMQAANPQAASAFSEQRIQQQAQAAQRPLITVVETSAVKESAKENVDLPGLGEVTVLGMAVLFVFISAQNTAMSIFKEKKLGSFRRLLAAPISNASLLGGKLLPNLIMCQV